MTETFTPELINGIIFLIIALTYLNVTTRVPLVGVIAVVPCLVLAIELVNDNPVHGGELLIPLIFVALAMFNGYFAYFGFKNGGQ